MKKYIPHVLILVVGFVIGILCRPHHIERVVDIQRDTTFLIDTHIIEKPVLVEKHTKDTLLVAVHDTTRIHDTLYLALPKETKTYKGEDYLARISGFQPSLDYIETYPKTTIITNTQSVTKRNTLSLGIEASYCNALSIPIYLEYERMLHKNVGIYGDLFYDLRTSQRGVLFGTNIHFGW